MLIGRSGPLDAQSDLIGAPEPMRIGALLAAPNERLGAQLFDAEHAGDGPAVVGGPPSSPADHAAPARFLVSTMGALAGPPTLRGWTAPLGRARTSELRWVFVV